MNKPVCFLLSLCMFAAALITPAFADVAGGVIYTFAIGIPLLIIAVFIILVALLVKAIRSRKK